jgi:protocatechuate 3,4-dioxygenase beta subunit
MHGCVRDAKTGAPLPNAIVDIWQASTNGTFVGETRHLSR